jgi:hypothetical protein
LSGTESELAWPRRYGRREGVIEGVQDVGLIGELLSIVALQGLLKVLLLLVDGSFRGRRALAQGYLSIFWTPKPLFVDKDVFFAIPLII